MQPDDRDIAHVWDMHRHALRLQSLVSGRSHTDIHTDDALRLSVERLLQIIGEASRRVSPGFQESHAEVPWRQMSGLRNILVHQYGDVNPDRLWTAATHDVPALVTQLTRLLRGDLDSR
jgi:uncharacterized protein with HEPN domain